MIGLIARYVWKHKWKYVLIAVTLIIYDITLLIPTQIIQGLVDKISHHQLTKVGLIQDVAFLLGTGLVSYVTALTWHRTLFLM